MPRSLFLKNIASLQGRQYMAPAGSDGAAEGGSAASDQGGDEGNSDGEGDAESDESTGDSGDESEGEAEGSEAEGGERKPTDEEARLLKDLMKQKKRAKEYESQLSETQTQLQQVKQILGDKSIDEVAALLQAQKEAETKELESKGEYKRILEQMREENEKVIGQARQEADELRNQLQSAYTQIEEMTIGRSFSESKFVTEDIVLPMSIARREFGAYFDLVDGQVVGYDKPRGSSDRTPLVDGKGENLSFEEALKKLVNKHPDSKSLLRAKARSGANSTTDSKVHGKTNTTAKPEVKGQSRIERALAQQ